MTFQFASMNLVIGLGIILAILIGWQFTLGEFSAGRLMIVIMVRRQDDQNFERAVVLPAR